MFLTLLCSALVLGIVVDNSFPRKVLRVNDVFKSSRSARIQSLEAKAADKNQSTKPNSIVCADCDGNGAKQCSQCKATGVNSIDHFNRQFKAGGLCWLCRFPSPFPPPPPSPLTHSSSDSLH